MPQRVDGSLQNAGVGQVKGIAVLAQNLATLLGLFNAQRCQVDIGPSGEAVL